MQLTIIRLILIGNSIFFLTSIREVISCLGVFFLFFLSCFFRYPVFILPLDILCFYV